MPFSCLLQRRWPSWLKSVSSRNPHGSGADSPGESQPIHDRHADIHQNGLISSRIMTAEAVYGGLTVSGDIRLAPFISRSVFAIS